VSRPRGRRLVLLAAALACSGGAAVAADGGGDSVAPLPEQGQVESEQASHFAVLRRPRTEADRLPEGAGGLADSHRGEPAAILALSRLARTSGGVSVWVIPGPGAVCHYATAEGLPGGGGGCGSTEQVLDGHALSATSPAPDVTRLIGLVPDGVDEVVLRAKDGTEERTVPEGNVYVFDTSHLPEQVEWGDKVVSAMSPLELP
jgi:hypothetical protein